MAAEQREKTELSGGNVIQSTAEGMMHGQPHEMFMSFFKTAGQATTRAMGTMNMQGHMPIPIVPL